MNATAPNPNSGSARRNRPGSGGCGSRKALNDSVATAPGEKIGPGDLAKGLKLLADGKAVDYQGATDIELTDVGDASGSYKEYEVKDGKFATVRIY